MIGWECLKIIIMLGRIAFLFLTIRVLYYIFTRLLALRINRGFHAAKK